jgi:transposase, IS5 family
MQSKVLLLQSWYGLSDPKLEKQLARDLMFRRFINLSLSEGVPDHSTIWRFRNLLDKQSLLEPLLCEVNRQLSQQGLFVKAGETSIVDATVIEAKQSRPRKNAKGETAQDAEAGYNVKVAANGKKASTYGFKAHINADEDGFIKAVAYTPGNEHDSHSLEKLQTLRERELYADKAYASDKHDKMLGQRGIENRILHKAKRNQPLSELQKTQNRRWSGHPQHRRAGLRCPQATLWHRQGQILGLKAQPSTIYVGGDGLQHQAGSGHKRRNIGVGRATPPDGRKNRGKRHYF